MLTKEYATELSGKKMLFCLVIIESMEENE